VSREIVIGREEDTRFYKLRGMSGETPGAAGRESCWEKEVERMEERLQSRARTTNI
jgi:hypothetical protein